MVKSGKQRGENKPFSGTFIDVIFTRCWLEAGTHKSAHLVLGNERTDGHGTGA